jgi:hypothetical protein
MYDRLTENYLFYAKKHHCPISVTIKRVYVRQGVVPTILAIAGTLPPSAPAASGGRARQFPGRPQPEEQPSAARHYSGVTRSRRRCQRLGFLRQIPPGRSRTGNRGRVTLKRNRTRPTDITANAPPRSERRVSCLQ